MAELKQARSDLNKAKERIEIMKTAKSLDEYENLWRDLLNDLDKCWNKSYQDPIKYPRFQPWQGAFVSKRKSDPLIKYLKQARDAENHSIQEIVEKEHGGVGFRFVGNRGYVESMSFKDGVLNHKGTPAIFQFDPAKINVKSVTNKGHSTIPPLYHLGQPIKNANSPIALSELGVAFYEKYLMDIETNFPS